MDGAVSIYFVNLSEHTKNLNITFRLQFTSKFCWL